MQGYRTYNMENHHSLHHEADQKPLVVDLINSHYGKPQTPPPSPNGKLFSIMKKLKLNSLKKKQNCIIIKKFVTILLIIINF